ncbi:transmembrane protein, putative (macronuclear) [Tetrahymena thermophila SB210]|uniref:Transmembrane protein, putative n=1 Tax=Tetrahymena thermophila (strain SB210) TaxID=312017 RepID=I7MI77_TETTS|nr:transmembrane protein, putative [Tetrahymena thermophila SB210]EAS03960.2 transmembrane protein, putative [Tetrahymena thermophila SB210]|eukprot:XP_001024205.2 transmembrane protein, putative [Tetrahymena thermophila SB210]
MVQKNKLVKLGILAFLLLGIVLGEHCNPDDTEECETCCEGTAPNAECIHDILKCPLKPNPNFTVLVTILYILAGFIVGIPLILFIIDKILCSNLFNCKMSFCELIANYICCCFCLSRDKPPIELEDMEEQENLDDSKKKKASNKISPEQK